MSYTPPKRRKISQAERKAVYEKYSGHCAYCGEKIAMSAMQVDHLIPMDLYEAYAAQGIDLDTRENYMPSCRSCNKYKHTLTIEMFRTSIERWPTVLMRDSTTYRNAVRFGQVAPTPHPVKFYFEKMEGGEQDARDVH